MIKTYLVGNNIKIPSDDKPQQTKENIYLELEPIDSIENSISIYNISDSSAN